MVEGNGLLAGKTCLVMGVLNRWSIGWAIAEAMRDAGARLVVTYLDERSKREIDGFLAEAPGSLAYQCDVESDEQLDALAAGLKADMGAVDCYVHSIGFAPAEALKGRFVDTSRDSWRIALSISAYSFVATAQRIAPLMVNGGSMMTMTYLGADRAFPNYNVMGVAKAALESSVRYLAMDLGGQQIRVNAISAGPIKSAAARGVSGFMDMYGSAKERSPLKVPFGAPEVGRVAVFLASDLAISVTGETLFVDNGYRIMGM